MTLLSRCWEIILAAVTSHLPCQQASHLNLRSGVRRDLVVAAACYSNQTLLVAGPAEAGRSRLLMASRDLTTPPLGTHIGLHVSVPGLRETLSELDMRIPGHILIHQTPCVLLASC